MSKDPTRCGMSDAAAGRSDSEPEILPRSKMMLRNANKRIKPDDLLRSELSEMRTQMTQMMNMLTALTTTQNEFSQKISSDISTIKEQLRDINSTTEKLVTEHNSLKLEVLALRESNKLTEEKVDDLKQKINQFQTTSGHITPQTSIFLREDIIKEVNDRDARSRNIIISGMAEPTSNNKEERIKVDKEGVIRLISEVDTNCPEPRYIMRLGKYNAQKTRPVKVCFTSQDTAKVILRNKNNIAQDNIKVFSDQTPQQQRYLKNLKHELERRIREGESNLSIKYIRGTPKIVENVPKNNKL